MTEFTSKFIHDMRERLSKSETVMFNHLLSLEALDHIEKQSKRIEELEIKQHIQWDANMMLTMADNSKGYIDLIIELQAKLKELEAERFNKCSDCCYVTPPLDVYKNDKEEE